MGQLGGSSERSGHHKPQPKSRVALKINTRQKHSNSRHDCPWDGTTGGQKILLITVSVAVKCAMEGVNVAELVERLGSEEDAVRKMAVFKLQTNIGDPSFAEVFISEGGLTKLRYLTLHASGNTLAYSLTSLSRLLDVDKGWESINQDLIERVGLLNWTAKRFTNGSYRLSS